MNKAEGGYKGSCACAAATPVKKKTSWPELEGVDGEEAKKKILEENPSLVVSVVPAGSPGTFDFRTDRVVIVVDVNNKVSNPPMIG